MRPDDERVRERLDAYDATLAARDPGSWMTSPMYVRRSDGDSGTAEKAAFATLRHLPRHGVAVLGGRRQAAATQ